MTKQSQNIGQNIKKYHIRFDLEIIADLIKENSKVLDIGCNDGELLAYLKKNKKADCRGLEISQDCVNKAIKKGISVVQGDAENDLSYYPDNSFDYAILSQTIQATKDPKNILKEMLRIANYAVVSLPNFAYYKNRFNFLVKGLMPVSETLPFSWYNTPNIHFCSIKDFENLCKELRLNIDERVYLTPKKKLLTIFGNQITANFFAEYGIFLISKRDLSATLQEEFAYKPKINISLTKNPALNLKKNE
ncbi:MAG: methionine biosynthesis protein MetW [Rickettsiales bacterium]|nr:methionine biosynthesis protein MetW [Rickettsiales bacterium]